MISKENVYQRIGEFVVSFQWLENKLREIGWFILNPSRSEWPPKDLRNLTNESLIDKVHHFFVRALPACKLSIELETEFNRSFKACVEDLHELRKQRNRILHSAFIELKAVGEVHAIMRSSPRFGVDEVTGESMFDQEILEPNSFDKEMLKMAEAALFLNRAYIQLLHRYPNGGE